MASDVIRLDFQVLIYPEGKFWIAHCLETDIASEGKTPKAAIKSLIDISNLQIEALLAEGDLSSLFSPAPRDIWRLFATALDRPSSSKRPRHAAKPINRINVRQLAPT